MSRLAKGNTADSRRGRRLAAIAEERPRIVTAGLDAASLMPAGCGLVIPRLDAVPVEQQLWEGEDIAARLAHSFLETNIADAADWIAANRNPFAFLKCAVERWLDAHGRTVIRQQFFLDVLLSTSLDRYCACESKSSKISKVFIALEPDSAGYVVLGPTLHVLDNMHPRLASTFVNLFLGALSRWVHVYDHREALDHVDRLRDWYETDQEAENIELPDIEGCLPKSVKRQPLGRRTLAAMLPNVEDPTVRRLLELAVEMDHVSSRHARPEIDESTRELLMDCGDPVPALLVVFEQHDSIEGCFDEDCQTMLEITPAPNVIIPFNGEAPESVLEAFAILSTICETLSLASRVITTMPGNARFNDAGGDT